MGIYCVQTSEGVRGPIRTKKDAMEFGVSEAKRLRSRVLVRRGQVILAYVYMDGGIVSME